MALLQERTPNMSKPVKCVLTVEYDVEIDDTDDYVEECIEELEIELDGYFIEVVKPKMHALLSNMMEQYHELRNDNVLVAC